MIALTVGLAVLVGISLGVLGGGGSILTVPLLAYVAGLEAKAAIATSLLVVGATSAVGAIAHARASRVQWRTGVIFGAAGMAGAYTGGLVSRLVPGPVLLVGFALMMIATAVAMLRGRREVDAAADARMPLLKTLLIGTTVGLVTGLIGAGGGFLVVPALALLGGLSMPVAVGTSLVVIASNSFAGFAGHLGSVNIEWRLAGLVTVAAVIGALVGSRLSAMIDPVTLRKAFGWFVLLMASVVLAQEVDPRVGIASAAITVVSGAAYAVCVRWADCPFRHHGLFARHAVG